MSMGPSCWDEPRIEAAALRSVDRDSSGGAGDVPEEIRAFLLHTKECVRCRELFELFVEVERQVRSEMAAEKESVVVLHEVREGPVIRLTDRERENGFFSLAADAPEETRAVPPVGNLPAPRSYASDDGRCRIRVIPNRTGEGATAILLQSPEDSRRPVILGLEGEIEFGDGVHAALPGLPGTRLEIRLR